MNIGWLRLTMLVEIDLNQATTGFAGMRTGYMRQLVAGGHTIKVLTPMGKKSIESYNHVTSGKDPVELGNWDCSWFNSVVYDPTGTPEDCDLLIVESSATQWMFGCSATHRPAIRRCAEILAMYKGKVVIEQSDPDLPFPFGKLAMTEFPWSAEDNPYRLDTHKGHQNLEAYGWADPEEIWGGKEYVVCVRATSRDRVLEDGVCNGLRFQYKNAIEKHPVSICTMPQTYDFTHHNVNIIDDQTKQYDIIYTGFPRSDSREKKFDNLFLRLPTPICRAVSGPWEKSKREYKMYDLLLEGVEYVGNLPWVELPVFISKSKFSLFLGVSKAYQMDWQTNKPFESISSGSVLLYDDIAYLREMIGDMFVINESNKKNWANVIVNITSEELSTLWWWQYTKIKKYDWAYYVRRLDKICGLEGKLKSPKKKTPDLELVSEDGVRSIISKYWDMFSVPLECRTSWTDRKMIFDDHARGEYQPPSCYETKYDEAVEFCRDTCPFRKQCAIATNTPKPAQEDTPEPSETVAAVSQEATAKPAQEAPETLPVPPVNISQFKQEGPTSRLVIEVAGKVDVTIIATGCTITVKTTGV